MNPIDRTSVRRGDERSLAGVVGAIVAAGGIAVTAGPLGVPVGIALLGAWALLSVPYVLALGHLGLAVLFPDGLSLSALALVEAGFLLVLVGPFARRSVDPRVSATALVVSICLAGIVAAGLEWTDSISAAALLFAIVAAILAYGLHRYELFRLGLVES